jgi:cobaltochelatase CobT
MQKLTDRLKAWLRPPVSASADPPPYRVYTKDFDKVVEGSKLDEVLGPLSASGKASLVDAWKTFEEALLGWKTKCAVAALEASARIRGRTAPETLRDTVVAILLDQSGSMRGQKMLLAAASVDVAQDFLRQLGCSVEVLGFTTVSWKGGNARSRWKAMFRPPLPGRLCDLLHIVYLSDGHPGGGAGGWWMRPMLRPDLPKENVDGEALEWAAARLRSKPKSRKILIVISDGAPVDDSTLLANGPDILVRHLREVIGRLQSGSDVAVAALGIGFDVDRYYSVSAKAETPEDLGPGLISLLERML